MGIWIFSSYLIWRPPESNGLRCILRLFVNDILRLISAKDIANSNFIFSLVFMAMTAFIVAKGIQNGIEAANKIMMPALYSSSLLL